ncbi:hypothetical protein [Labilibaculum euxinus]
MQFLTSGQDRKPTFPFPYPRPQRSCYYDHNSRATTTATVVVLRLQRSWYCDCNSREKTRADSFESTPEYNFTVKLYNLISRTYRNQIC